jgi:predicted enzyme related to lactoylglutathione lyase
MTMVDGGRVLGIDTTTYLVKDVERAKAFYRDTLGMPLASEFGESGAEFVFGDNTAFSLWKMDDGTWYPSHGVMFSVADFEGTIERWRTAGVKIMEHTEDTPVCKMGFAEDSEGNTFIIHFRKHGRS